MAGAQARARLIKAAAQDWDVQQKDCVAEHGVVIHRPTGRRLGYGVLAPAAAGINPPRHVKLKHPDQCRLLGCALPRLDIQDMVAGRTVYGIDVSLPGLRVATVLRCPVVGGKVRSCDPDAALAIPGVEQVLRITSGLAVVAGDTWSSLKGRQALKVTWDPGPHGSLNTAAILAQINAGLEQKGDVRQRVGQVEHAFKQAVQIVEADYATAHLAHATLEPMNCTARVSTDGCEVWVGTQSQEGVRETASRVSGQPLARVKVYTQYLGGGFGRRLESDMVAEAVEIAKAVDRTVQVVWSRADDMQHDHYRPAHRAHLRAAVDEAGWPVAWFQRSCGQKLAGEACSELPYAIPNVQVEFVEVDSPVPAGAWRSVGAGQDAFVVESFIDELAQAAGKDPYRYRRTLLRASPRHCAVLDLAAAKAGWTTPPPAGRHRGIAVYQS